MIVTIILCSQKTERLERESCQLCDKRSERCEVVSTVFTRRIMKMGYQCITTIPFGACNVTVKEDFDTGNFLALRWNNDGQYFLNGNWMIRSGSTFIKRNTSFSHQFNVHKKERIRFVSPLSEAVDICIIFQKKNQGIAISYSLPPLKSAKRGQSEVKEASDLKLEQTNGLDKKETYGEVMVDRGTTAPSLAKEKGLISSKKHDHQYLAAWLKTHRASAQAMVGAPKWVSEFANIMIKWRHDLEVL